MNGKTTESLLLKKAAQIKLLLTDCDGVLTDAGVYYTAYGEEMKRFNMRDGMGVERLQKLAKVDVGIITGENSLPVARRATKLDISELHLSCKDKTRTLFKILEQNDLRSEQVAYIGDDVNDEEVMKLVGLSACPADAMEEIRKIADFVCQNKGGHGAFRDFAEFIIQAKQARFQQEKIVLNGQAISITL
jgi:3-deoxy-D-manno-octulosonate 8-phosphate phosphatase (KDO 8-P phosphatase)